MYFSRCLAKSFLPVDSINDDIYPKDIVVEWNDDDGEKKEIAMVSGSRDQGCKKKLLKFLLWYVKIKLVVVINKYLCRTMVQSQSLH